MTREGNKKYVQGWTAIATYFPFCESTLRNRYSKEMLEAGFVFKTTKRRGSIAYPIVWTFEYLIHAFISKKQAQQGFV